MQVMGERKASLASFFLEGVETNTIPGKIGAILQNGMTDVTETASLDDGKFPEMKMKWKKKNAELEKKANNKVDINKAENGKIGINNTDKTLAKLRKN